jgi:hypothetical protein
VRTPRRPQKQCAEPPDPNVTDLLVRPGNPPHRREAYAKTNPARLRYRMVALATGTPSLSTISSYQTKIATVMLGPENSVRPDQSLFDRGSGNRPALAISTPTDSRCEWHNEPIPPARNISITCTAGRRQDTAPIRSLMYQVSVNVLRDCNAYRRTRHALTVLQGAPHDENPLQGCRARRRVGL